MQETYGLRRKLCPNNFTKESSFYWIYRNYGDLYLANACLLRDMLSFLIYMKKFNKILFPNI